MTTHISHYRPMNFKRVCRVNVDPDGLWHYSNINARIMFSPHRSWLYMITIDGIVWKIGETGNPLGIRLTRGNAHPEVQPKYGTQSRLGRYRNGDGTDQRCREELNSAIAQGRLVEFWARRCPTEPVKILLDNNVLRINSHHHKDLEMALIDYYVKHTGRLPEGNLSRK